MRVLAIAAHPDDETLGCGASLLRHADAGDSIHWLIATRPTEPEWDPATIERKAEEIDRVSKAYGFGSVHRLTFPAAALDTIPQRDLLEEIRAVVREVEPELVYSVRGNDVHSDHEALFGALASVLKPFHMEGVGVRRWLACEIPSSTDAAPQSGTRPFEPQVYRDVTGYVDRKAEIMELYRTEAHADPRPRGPSAIQSLARVRGATIGVESAEAFELVREIDLQNSSREETDA